MRPPLLLVHGAFSQAAHFEPWLAYFRESGYRATAISLPGHAPVDPGALARLTLDDYVGAVAAAVRSFEQPPVVIGHSMGGILAMRIAAAERIAGLVVIAAPAPGGLPARIGVFRLALPFIPRVLAGLPMVPRPEIVRALVTHDLSAAESDEIIALGGMESGRVLRRLAIGGSGVKLAGIRCPMLCLGAGDDRFVPPSAASRIAQATGAELVVFAGHGHWLIAGSLVGSVAATARDWLERHFARAG
jgi:pimeloyl-ACP methyl ester carboxylesterase